MNTVFLFLFCVLSVVSGIAQRQKIAVMEFQSGNRVTDVEANTITNYTIVQLESIDKADILSSQELGQYSGMHKGTIGFSDEVKVALQKIGVNYVVSGTVTKNDSSDYVVLFKVSDFHLNLSCSETYVLPVERGRLQNKSYQNFLQEKTQLKEVLQSLGFLSTLSACRLSDLLSVSYGSEQFSGKYQKHYFTPISVSLDASLSPNTFFLYGGSIVLYDVVNKPSIPQLVRDAPKRNFFTLKAGFGVKLWRARMFTSFEYQMAGVIQKLPSGITLPKYYITTGTQFYIYNKVFAGAELFFYHPLEYVLDANNRLTTKEHILKMFPAISIGYQY
ncbi:MAG: hypothetical protein KGZ58_04340 [Ignavibacteriales bacterium]|nr:hypothetical protein [Ignavibacteriales bacterium]